MEGTIWTVIGTLVTIGTFMRRRGVKPAGKSHSICWQHFLSALEKNKAPDRKGMRTPDRRAELLHLFTFFWRCSTPFSSMVKSHAACLSCGGLQSYICLHFFYAVYVFFGGVPFARLRSLARNALDRLLRPKQVDLCAVSGASPVGNEALLAVRNSWNQSIRGWITPIQPNMLAAIDVCNKKKIVAWRPFIDAWNPSTLLVKKWFTVLKRQFPGTP